MGRGDLTDEPWTLLEPLLPRGTKAGRLPVWPRRQLIDGIRFRVRTGVPWRDIHVEYSPWNRVYELFRRWQRNGTWQRIFTRLQSLADAKGAIVWDPSIDSTVCRAHQHAAGSCKRGDLQKEPPGDIWHGARSVCPPSPKLSASLEQGDPHRPCGTYAHTGVRRRAPSRGAPTRRARGGSGTPSRRGRP
ncbi:transposase [Streptomyces sp. NPDC055051]